MTVRTLLRTALTVFLAGGLLSATALADQRWQRVEAVQAALNGLEPVTDGLELELPLVAEDGSSVTLNVRFDGELGADEHIEKIRVFAPGNPRPEVADYALTPMATPVDITTRIRLSETQQVVALAFTSAGRAFLTTRDVRVTVSGCLIGGGLDASSTQMENPRLAFAGEVRPGQPVAVRSLINHPMETGLRPDGEAAGDVDPLLIETLTVTLDDEPVFRSRFYTGTAANPYVQFTLSPQQAGEVGLTWQDQNGETVQTSRPIHF